jgi:hypothetical protein
MGRRPARPPPTRTTSLRAFVVGWPSRSNRDRPPWSRNFSRLHESDWGRIVRSAVELDPGAGCVAASNATDTAVPSLQGSPREAFDLGELRPSRPRMADRSMWPNSPPATVMLAIDERMNRMDATIAKTNEISSALRCRLSEAAPPESVDPDAQHRHLLLQRLAQDARLDAQPVSRRGLFRRSR